MDLLPDKKSSKFLQKAWDLDQEALLRAKDDKKKKLLWKESINICKRLLKDFSDNINLLTKIATIYQHQGKFYKAKYFLNKAKKFRPKNFLVDFYFGNLYRAKGNSRLALKYYNRSYKLSKSKIIKKAIEDYKGFLEKVSKE